MPNIRTYENTIQFPRPSSANAQAAASIGEIQSDTFHRLGEQIEGTVKFIDRENGKRETSKLTNDYAQSFAGLTQDWNDTASKADPNDDTVAEKWRQEVLEPRLDKFGEDISSSAGTELRQRLQAEMRMHFFEKSAADQSALAGAAVKTNLEQAGNALSEAARLDPSSMDASIRILNASLEQQIKAHTLTPAQAAQFRAEVGTTLTKGIALSAAFGSAERNPDATERDLAAGKYNKYLDGEDVYKVQSYIDTQKKAVELEKRRQEAEARQAKKDAGEEASSTITSAIITDPTKIDPRKDIASNPYLDDTQKRVLSGFLEHQLDQLKGPAEEKTGPGFWDAYQRVMGQGPSRISDPMDIYKMAGPGKPLTLLGAQKLVTLMKERASGEKVGNFDTQKINRFFTSMHEQVTNPSGFGKEPESEPRYFQFYMDKTKAIEEGRAKGKTLDSMLNPESPDYIGKDVKNYQPPVTDQTLVTDPPPEAKTWFGWLFGDKAATTPKVAAPTRPAEVPSGAKFSPSKKEWWWQVDGKWQHAPAAK